MRMIQHQQNIEKQRQDNITWAISRDLVTQRYYVSKKLILYIFDNGF